MHLIHVVVINVFGLLMPCQCIEFLDIILNDTNVEQQWTTTDLDAEEFVRNKIRFLKLLPLNKDWKSKIGENGIQTENKSISSVPIVLILATAGSSEEVRDSIQSETSVDTNSMISRNDDVQDVKEEIDPSSTETSVSLNETNQETKDAVNEIEETLDYTIKEELTTTENPLNDEEDENIHEIDKEDLATIEDIKNDIEHVLEECKNDKNCKFIPEVDTSEVAEDLFVSQDKYSLEDPSQRSVNDGKSLDKSYKLSIVINKYIVVK